MRFNGVPLRKNLVPLIAYYNLGSAVKLRFERITHFTERGQRLPARLLGTLSRYSVALALFDHVFLDSQSPCFVVVANNQSSWIATTLSAVHELFGG